MRLRLLRGHQLHDQLSLTEVRVVCQLLRQGNNDIMTIRGSFQTLCHHKFLGHLIELLRILIAYDEGIVQLVLGRNVQFHQLGHGLTMSQISQ